MTGNINRRGFLKGTLASAAMLVAGANLAKTSKPVQPKPAKEDRFMPDESAPHSRTWMAFGAQRRHLGE